MMYRQSIQNIKLVIIPLDGVILDLNHLRYNYYKYTASQKNITVSREAFSRALSNMYDMYNELPLHSLVDSGPLNAKIERELFQYAQLKKIQVKDGVYEFIEYLKQKNIPVAILSTHRTKDAVEYLKMVNLYQNVQFIIGSDTSSLPLPSSSILETINKHFHVPYEETLVISSFESLNRVASSLHMNIVYLEDLVKADDFINETSYRVVSSMFEILNAMLFDKYENTGMYSTILGMDDHMNEVQLSEAYNHAKSAYNDDEQIMELVDKTYQYRLSQLQPEIIKEKKEPVKHFVFDDEEVNNEVIFEENCEEELQVEQETFSKEIPLEKPQHMAHVRPMTSSEEDELHILLNKINKKKEVTFPLLEESFEQVEEDGFIEEEKEHHLFLDFFTTLIYILATSFLILIVGIVFTVAFIHPLRLKEGIFGIVAFLFTHYNDFVTMIFETFFNGVHSVLEFIPDYEGYNQALAIFSKDGIQLLNLYIFHCLVLGVLNLIKVSLKRDDNEDD